MKRKKSPLAIVILVAVVAILLAGGFAYYNYSASHSYVATIAGEKIKATEFKFFYRLVRNEYEVQAGVDTDENAKKDFWKTTKIEGDSVEVKAKNETLEQLKEFKILLLKAKESKVELDKTELDNIKQRIDQIIEEDGNGNRAAASAEVKKKYGVSLSDYEEIYKNYMLAYGKFSSQLTEKVQPTDKDLKDYYDQNKSTYPEVLIKQVFISTVDPTTRAKYSEENIAVKKKQAEEIYQKAKDGANFEDLVKQYSEDPDTKDAGGDLKVARDDTYITQKVKDWAVIAKDGDIGLVEADDGFYIVKYSKKLAYDDSKEDVEADYRAAEVSKQIEAWKKEEKYNIQRNQKALDSI